MLEQLVPCTASLSFEPSDIAQEEQHEDDDHDNKKVDPNYDYELEIVSSCNTSRHLQALL